MKITPLFLIKGRLWMSCEQVVSRLAEMLEDRAGIVTNKICLCTLAIYCGNTATVIVEVKIIRHHNLLQKNRYMYLAINGRQHEAPTLASWRITQLTYLFDIYHVTSLLYA